MSIKQDRMGERVRGILSELLLRDVADPRLQGITITQVDLDSELMFAKVYVNALGDEGRKDAVLSVLNRAKGFLRRELGKRVRLRNVPDLHFHWDASLERAERIIQLISTLEIPPEEKQDGSEANTLD